MLNKLIKMNGHFTERRNTRESRVLKQNKNNTSVCLCACVHFRASQVWLGNTDAEKIMT